MTARSAIALSRSAKKSVTMKPFKVSRLTTMRPGTPRGPAGGAAPS